MNASDTEINGRTESPDPASHAANIYDTEGDWVDDPDDDDMDFEPTTEDSEDNEYFEAADDDDMEYHDADDGLSGVEIEFRMDDGEVSTQAGAEETDASPPPGAGTASGATGAAVQVVSRNQILQLLGHAGLRRIFANTDMAGLRAVNRDDEEDDDDEDGFGGYGGLLGRYRRRPKSNRVKPPPVPSEEGRKLMDSGCFGSNVCYREMLRKHQPRLNRRLMDRELGMDFKKLRRQNKLITQGMLPESNADTIIHYDSRCYSGQFSDDGNFFFSCAQDFKVRMYDTSNPYDWKYYKTVVYPYGQWTITDATLSPDNKYLAYSSIRSSVCLAPTDPGDTGEPHSLDFADTGDRGGRRRYGGFSHFGIWSIRFSGDGRELVAGTSDHSVYVYDIESRQSILKIQGHTEDVNAVCFGDTSSPHILYSGSDDTLIKVWDRRSMGDSREAGVFMGHTEGLTYVDSKGDGRYVLSNGKDQTMKLWDLRKMMPTEKASTLDPAKFTTGFDYRFMRFAESDYRPHPHDCSLVTYRGHRVLKTLIRCHFSPPGSSDSRYVYSGSECGSVYIYNLDATLAAKVDVNKTTHDSRPKDSEMNGASSYDIDDHHSRTTWKTCVRDASWHPNAPMIAATSWNGWGMSTGTCTIHSWNDGLDEDEAEPKMGRRVDQRLEEDPSLYGNPSRSERTQRRGIRSQRVTRAMGNTNGW
ncbi:MAG: hypothetical protein MMC33_006484 [Icmadophila ericetorum]|nr:hypothetical protein [Icmadophila ericetorum]